MSTLSLSLRILGVTWRASNMLVSQAFSVGSGQAAQGFVPLTHELFATSEEPEETRLVITRVEAPRAVHARVFEARVVAASARIEEARVVVAAARVPDAGVPHAAPRVEEARLVTAGARVRVPEARVIETLVKEARVPGAR